MEYWADSESFERLLFSSSKDKEFAIHLENMFPTKAENEFLVISKKELREYLYKEMINFYSHKRKWVLLIRLQIWRK